MRHGSLPQDLVIPSFKPPGHYELSPLQGIRPRKRDIFFFFKGDVGKRRPNQGYSRGIRQRIYNMAKEQDWKKKYNALVGRRLRLCQPAAADAAWRCQALCQAPARHAPARLGKHIYSSHMQCGRGGAWHCGLAEL